MKKIIFLLFIFTGLQYTELIAQKLGAGIGIYPTGTEPGFGYRSAKNTRWAADIRIAKANIFSNPTIGSFVNEVSVNYRLVYYEKVRFYIGLGGRADWNFDNKLPHRFGFVTPIGIEAFPFPFQNAGLFFEAAGFFTFAGNGNHNFGVRTVAGFVFYIIRKNEKE